MRGFLAALVFLSGCAVTVDAPDTAPGLVIFDGNSLTYGLGATPGHTYPEDVAAELGPGHDYLNVGVGGQTTREMLADAATEVDAKHPAIVVAWEIGNALYYWQRSPDRGQDPETAWGDFVTYCNARRSAGAKVVVLTVTPRTIDYADPPWTAAVESINGRMRQDWRSFADGLADVAAEPGLQDPARFPDGVHLNDQEYAIVAGVVATTIRGL